MSNGVRWGGGEPASLPTLLRSRILICHRKRAGQPTTKDHMALLDPRNHRHAHGAGSRHQSPAKRSQKQRERENRGVSAVRKRAEDDESGGDLSVISIASEGENG